MRRAARTDNNHARIVDALRAAGCSVESLADVGRGVPDLLVGVRGETYLLEVKGPRGFATPDQRAWWDRWRGRRPIIVRDPAEALAAVGINAGLTHAQG
jgi:hypothetical protein